MYVVVVTSMKGPVTGGHPLQRLTYLLHGAESLLRSQLVLSYSRNSPHFMEPEGSLPHSHVPATCPYPEPDRSSPGPYSSHRVSNSKCNSWHVPRVDKF